MVVVCGYDHFSNMNECKSLKCVFKFGNSFSRNDSLEKIRTLNTISFIVIANIYSSPEKKLMERFLSTKKSLFLFKWFVVLLAFSCNSPDIKPYKDWEAYGGTAESIRYS